LESPARTWGAFRFMAEGNPHGVISQLPALRCRQFVHPWTVLLHD